MCKRFVLMRTAGDVGPYKHAVVYACKSQFIVPYLPRICSNGSNEIPCPFPASPEGLIGLDIHI